MITALFVGLFAASPAGLPVIHTAEEVVLATGKRPTVVHFWATWCGTCTAELPEIQRLESGLAAEGVDLLFVSLDDPKKAAEVERFMRQKKMLQAGSRGVILDAPDPASITSRFSAKWSAQLPATFFLLDSGAVLASHLGTTPVDLVLKEVHQQQGSKQP